MSYIHLIFNMLRHNPTTKCDNTDFSVQCLSYCNSGKLA